MGQRGEGMGQHKAALGRQIGLHRIPFNHMHSPSPNLSQFLSILARPAPTQPTNKIPQLDPHPKQQIHQRMGVQRRAPESGA
jgi:hypothetical protein